MPAEAGIQGWQGMDTGFRRYDEIVVPIRRPDRTGAGIFYEDHEGHKVLGKKIIPNFVLFVSFVVKTLFEFAYRFAAAVH